MIVKDNSRIIFDNHFLDLKGNYIFGRNRQKCLLLSERLSAPTSLVAFPNPPNYISGIHAVMCEIEGCFCLIDGWGRNYSRNGVYLNGERIYYAPLKDKDIIHLGTKNIEIVFSKTVEDYEKVTEDSQFL